MTVKWYQWDTWELFNEWQDNLCVELAYPWEASNQATGELEPDATYTVRYTDGREVEGYVIAIVGDEYSEGLTETQLRPPTPPIPPVEDSDEHIS